MKYYLFSLLVLVLSFLPQAFAKEDIATVSVTPTPTPVPEYALPYPGILPTSLFYSVKMVRDRVILLLIADPIKKARYNLLQADKRMEAAVFLINQDKRNADLAVVTIQKGENYFFDATQQAVLLFKQGRDVHDLLINLDHAAITHRILLTNLQKQLPDKSAELEQVKTRMESYHRQIQQALE